MACKIIDLSRLCKSCQSDAAVVRVKKPSTHQSPGCCQIVHKKKKGEVARHQQLSDALNWRCKEGG